MRSLGLLGGGVEDEHHHTHNHHHQQAEHHQLLIRVLLVLVGLGKVLTAGLQVGLDPAHGGGRYLQLHSLLQDHVAGVQGDLVDFSDQHIDLVELLLLFLEYLAAQLIAVAGEDES